MANKHRGELAFEVEGKNYTLCYSTNALCEMEGALDVSISEIGAMLGDVGKMKMKTVRAVLWAGLTDRHAGITIKQTGEIVDAISMPRAIELIGEAFKLSFGEGRAAGNGVADPRPPGSQPDGTGPAS